MCGRHLTLLWSAWRGNWRVEVVDDYLTSQHRLVRCIGKLQRGDKWIQQIKVPWGLPGVSGGRINDKNKDRRQE